jgi:magnesium transporter
MIDFQGIDFIQPQESKEVQEILETPSYPSVFEAYEKFQLLNLRMISLHESALSFKPEAFIIHERDVYYFKRESKSFEHLQRGYRDLLELLTTKYASNQKFLSAYSAEIEKLEDALFLRKIPSYFMDMWFDLKKDLAKIENFYYLNSVTYKEFFTRSSGNFRELTDEFKDIDDVIHFQMSNHTTLKARLDSLHHYYASIKNDRLNKTLLALTLISGVFLPLNLIVGFFGMNTQGLFFGDSPDGTQKVVFILMAIVALLIVGVPLIKLIDKYFLRFLLGRYDFYQSIAKRIGRLDPHLKLK